MYEVQIEADLGIGLLKKLIARAGLTNQEYIDIFYEFDR